MKQLTYLSESTRALDAQEMHALLVHFRENNLRHNITGVLFLIHNRFLQYLEGEAEAIDQLVDNIRQDPLNTNFVILDSQRIATRQFPEWSMGFRTFSIDEFAREDGFFDLDDEEKLGQLAERNEEVIKLMRMIYRSV